MDSKWVKTSLDLNLNIPFDHDTGEVPLSELQKKLEFKGDSDNFEEKLPVKEEVSTYKIISAFFFSFLVNYKISA
ncbi:hypothetical protein L484_015562 [Morus notabilis]|uniref:Uncharacterized protein n=1 Tax=Morus notabilis TaxID=981085 RepID=W9SRV5_9ROSA|nr:hypothetical protein L484_015562 [Morus notabilis]